MRPSLKSKEDWPAKAGRGRQDKRRPGSAGGLGCEINSFGSRTERLCDTHLATRGFYFGFKSE
jgi:hypothetical protein